VQRLAILVLASVTLAGCAQTEPVTPLPIKTPVTTLQIKEVRAGSGTVASPGRTVRVHYTGKLLDGTEFDSSRGRGEPIEFRLGTGDVIPGWDEGIKGMRVGGVRELTIPSSMAYGAEGRGDVIPPDAPLWFEVELVGVQ
jgi:FKBP-type peptidyl-prolyl cis-trans isomerase